MKGGGIVNTMSNTGMVPAIVTKCFLTASRSPLPLQFKDTGKACPVEETLWSKAGTYIQVNDRALCLDGHEPCTLVLPWGIY